MSNSVENNQTYTFRDPIIRGFGSLLDVIKNHTNQLFLFALIGGIFGLSYSYLYPTTYKAQIKFYIENTKSANSGLMSMVASQIGIDVGSLMAGNSVLDGDNVLELAKSKILLQKALQTPYPNLDGDSIYSLADKYVDAMGWKRKWARSKKVGYEVSFAVNKKKFNRVEDSLWQVILKRIVEKELHIIKPDRKLSFYTIDLETRDEILSKLLTERILETTIKFYINTKIGSLKKNVDRLQNRVDSFTLILNSKTYNAASVSVKNEIDINFAMSKPIADIEIKNKEKVYASVIYGELLKNLEIMKTALIQETPSIIIVDESKIPRRYTLKWYMGIFFGIFLGALAGILFYFKFNRY